MKKREKTTRVSLIASANQRCMKCKQPGVYQIERKSFQQTDGKIAARFYCAPCFSDWKEVQEKHDSVAAGQIIYDF